MIITDIEPIDKKRVKVYIDESCAFPLYLGEIRKFGIKKDEEISIEVYNEIWNDVLIKRCRLRAMNILKNLDKTEKQIRDKLSRGFYPEEIIDDTISYLKSYKYIDDKRYAEHYVEYRISNKSRKQLVRELMIKGIDKNEAANSIPEDFKDDESIKAWIKKKRYNGNTATSEERQKMCLFLMRRGYEYDDINRILKSYNIDENY